MYVCMQLWARAHSAMSTIFIQIVATATINFSLAEVWLLIEGGSYSRVAFINFGTIPPGAMHKTVTQNTGL